MAAPRKLPTESFEYYLGLGVGRSYQAVADHYGVQKSTVVIRGKKENWQDRIAELERLAREQFEADARTELTAVHERQLKAARALQAKALAGLRDLEPERAVKMANALNIGWKHELLLLGEPTERASNVEEVTRREVRDLLVVVDGPVEEDWAEVDPVQIGPGGESPEALPAADVDVEPEPPEAQAG